MCYSYYNHSYTLAKPKSIFIHVEASGVDLPGLTTPEFLGLIPQRIEAPGKPIFLKVYANGAMYFSCSELTPLFNCRKNRIDFGIRIRIA